MRGETADRPRVLTFVAGALAVEIEIRSDAVRGQLLPAQAGTVRVLVGGNAVIDIPADDVGWFVVRADPLVELGAAVHPVPTGKFRLHVRTATGESVLTGWIDESTE